MATWNQVAETLLVSPIMQASAILLKKYTHELSVVKSSQSARKALAAKRCRYW